MVGPHEKGSHARPFALRERVRPGVPIHGGRIADAGRDTHWQGLHRVSRGKYELRTVPEGIGSSAPKLFEESVVRSITQTPTQRDVRHRTLQLAANFDAYVAHFQSHVPFTKPRE